MKKILSISLVVILIMISACCNVNAQNNETGSEVVSIDLSKLSPEAQNAVKAQIELDAAALNRQAQSKLIEKEIDTYTEWAGKGKEIGEAVSGGLNAIKDVTLELAESDVGKITIWLIIWKVAGIDFLRIIIGMILMLIATIAIFSSYSRTFKRKILIKGGKGQPKEWESKSSNSFWEYPNAAAMAHVLIWVAILALCTIVMFA